jgi:uncharacterized protein (DUF427 family)
VWAYPRPPLVERVSRRAVLRHGGLLLADSDDLVRVCETSHPPTYYLPRTVFDPSVLVTGQGRTFCEWKGVASYVDVLVPGVPPLPSVGWWYPDSNHPELTGRVALYAGPVDEVSIDGEPVTPQPGGLYGGWITSDVVGPFKGGPGSNWW